MGKIRVGMRGPGIEESTAVPESKMFNDPNRQLTRRAQLAGYHVDGVPFETWADGMPDHIVDKMTYGLTDEGLAEQAKRDQREASRVAPPRRAMTATDVDKQMQEREDFMEDLDDYSAAPDARQDLVEQFVEPGMRARFVSETKLGKAGRDPRGFVPVVTDKGEVVRHGTSVLAQMPEKRADAILKRRRDSGNELLEQVYARADDKRLTPSQMLETSPTR